MPAAARSTMKTAATLLLLAAGAYAALALAIYLFQARLVYFPQIARDVTTTPRVIGLAYEEVWLESAPGVRIHGWFVPRAAPKGTVVFFHGNAGSIGLRVDWLRMFHDLGYAALVVDYRGYGRSEGEPSERGTYEDATAAWDHLVRTRGVAPGDIVIVGESLGGAIAAELAARTSPRALVIQSTFTSVPDLAAELYPFLPVRWLSRFRYDTRERLARVSAPVFVAHSPDDELIPFRHGQALHASAREPKTFLALAGGHNEAFIFVRPAWVGALAEFLRAHEPPAPA